MGVDQCSHGVMFSATSVVVLRAVDMVILQPRSDARPGAAEAASVGALGIPMTAACAQ